MEDESLRQNSLRSLEYPKILELLAQEAQSALGQKACYALRPQTTFAAAVEVLSRTDDLVKELLQRGDLGLSSLEDVAPLLQLLELGSDLGPADFLRFAKQMRLVSRLQARQVKAVEKDLEGAERSGYCRQVIDDLSALPDLAEEIDACILNDEELRDHASPELYHIRRQIQDLQEQIKDALSKLVNKHREILQDQLITLRDNRYVIPVKAEFKGQISGLVHDSSATGSTYFIEPMEIVNLNNQIREAKFAEIREIHRILHRLGQFVLSHASDLRHNQKSLAELDFTQAKAKLALRQKAHAPILNQEGRIVLRAARHPLIDPRKVVAIDFELGVNFTSLIITGPNTGGKTVSLKTCGLLTLMAQSGLQVPAAPGSEIAFFPQVLADIGDEQSIEQSLSTFSAHMKQVIQICRVADDCSLVILDELGAGTDPSEGAALAIAILEYLRRRETHIVASTHYQELKGYAMNTEGVSNACCEFDSESMRPTYKLLIGVPGVSNALAISTRLGLDPQIIDMAKSFISDEGAKFQSLIESIERSERQSREMAEEVRQLQLKTKREREKHEAELVRLQKEKREILEQAKRSAYEIVAEAEAEAEAELKNLRALGLSQKEQEDRKQALRERKQALAKDLEQAALTARQDRPLLPQDLVIGDSYQDVLSGFRGQLKELPDSQDQVLLSRGNLQIRVPFTQLRFLPDAQTKPGQKQMPTERRRSQPSQTHLNFKPELYLLGERVNTALDKVDSFLDDACLMHMDSVRIIHGKGTGALRLAIRDKLKKDKRVKAFGDAAFGAGDAGVTVVELQG